MNENKYAWRPATKADIGSVARFCRPSSLTWEYGILLGVSELALARYQGLGHFGFQWFSFCEIQYVADDEP